MKSYSNRKAGLKDRARSALSTARGVAVEADLRPYLSVVASIRTRNLSGLSDGELCSASHALIRSFREKTALDASAGRVSSVLDELLPEAYALVCEACRRCLAYDPYDEQLVAGIALHQGKLAQMNTGEGKTLAAVFPAYLNSLTESGVHVLTANDYLARRDAEWMGPVYRMLGVQAASIDETGSFAQRVSAYAADITYLTARQAGFDYLYDGLVYEPGRVRQRSLSFAIVDEADFILIDEARIPMVIATAADPPRVDPVRIDAVAARLQSPSDFLVDRAGRVCSLTLAGESKVQQMLGCGGRHEEDSYDWYSAVHVALHARHLLRRDADYVVTDGKIELVDEFTGRVAERRRWPYGIQTALEAAEGLPIQPEGTVCARITVESFLSLYSKLAAMTATALPAAEELNRHYGLATVIVPPHRPEATIHCEDRVFGRLAAKEAAITGEIHRAHSAGRPVLVGTRTVGESERLAARIRALGIDCAVLNARNDDEEARIIAQAGMRGAVTISTNMAGRGTDIRLGGEKATRREREAIVALGGLYVIGTTRQESKRVDDQLRGRAGRQGDPGRTQFFVSLEDELVVKYGVDEFIPVQFRQIAAEGEIRNRNVAREILRAQRIIEHQHTQMRETLRHYSTLVEAQRKQLRGIRDDALAGRMLPVPYIEACRSAYSGLEPTAGDEAAEEAAVRCLLRSIDTFWSEHLDAIEDLWEGIHLQRLGGKEPLLVFIQEVVNRFDHGLDEAISKAAEDFSEIEPGPDGRIDFHAAALHGPSSTWTYLINDNPFPDFNLSMIANSNIGVAAAAAFHMLFLWPLLLFSKLLARLRRA